MKLRKLAFIAAAATLTLSLAGCEKLFMKALEKAITPELAREAVMKSVKEDIDKFSDLQKTDLSQLSRNDFNHAALRLNLPIFWVYEETPSNAVKPELLTTLNFYPTSDSFVWKNEKGEFTDDFYRAYNQMVNVMKDPLFGAAPQKERLSSLKYYQENYGLSIDKGFENLSRQMAEADEEGDKDKKEVAEFVKNILPDPDVIKADAQKFIDEQLADKSITGEFSDSEKTRLNKVAEELDQAAVTVVATDFSASEDKEKAFVQAMLKVGGLIDGLYAKQLGIDKILDKIPENDVMSRSMVRRNWGVDAESPKMKNDKTCRAIAGDDKIPVGIYPEELQSDPEFCAKLDARSDAETLLDHFSVVVKADDKIDENADKEEKKADKEAGTDKKAGKADKKAGKADKKVGKADKNAGNDDKYGENLKPVPYNEYFKDDMTAISNALKEAAAALEGNEKEAALQKYLNAAADSFLSNNWEPADEAWAAMNSTNSAWYVRVAPDETYWEPCGRHAGFHMTFAKINPDALVWQEKLNPLQQDMEKEMAKIAGKPYKERKVSFHLPDFIDIVTNSGDDRDSFGATIGQSLPNWGPVANEGRGRTVAMSNLYTDPDSLRDRKTLASSMFTEKDMELLKDGKGPGLLSTIIHEAAHNLGPAHEYTVKGKKDNEIYGGTLASMAEEFKAQTAALWYLPYLVKKGAIDQKLANESYADSIYWAFGHISKGMTNAEGRIQPYSQLAAIQIGMMLEDGALKFDPEAMAANGTDKGAFIIDLEKMPKSVERIMKAIAQSKASGDKEVLVKLQKQHVEGTAIPFDIIKERMLRLPKTSFVYSVTVQ